MTSDLPEAGDKVHILTNPYSDINTDNVYIKSIVESGAFLTNVESLEVEDHKGDNDEWCLYFLPHEFEVMEDQNG